MDIKEATDILNRFSNDPGVAIKHKEDVKTLLDENDRLKKVTETIIYGGPSPSDKLEYIAKVSLILSDMGVSSDEIEEFVEDAFNDKTNV